MPERLIGTDCKSVALSATKVRILFCPNLMIMRHFPWKCFFMPFFKAVICLKALFSLNYLIILNPDRCPTEGCEKYTMKTGVSD